MAIKAIAPWFGSNRVLPERVADELGDLKWCGVPFMGGAPELAHIRTRAGVANDLHCHVVNLARVIKVSGDQLVRRLEGVLFHPDELDQAQARCASRAQSLAAHDYFPDLAWAADYFIACWMGRGGSAGKRDELYQSLALRYTSSGGSSARRWQSAIGSIRAWSKALSVWEFTRDDGLNVLARCKDEVGHGLYIDAPWPTAGHDYAVRFGDDRQAALAEALAQFQQTRVVIRFNDHPLIQRLYPESRWTWLRQSSTNQQGNEVAEVLILNGPSKTGGAPE